MEMHQVRYFLAVARVLNFTRAAEECHVAQPSLTRAIKQLEHELGGELFRRERNLTHLSDLGQRMLPFMQQCYDSAISAKSLAKSIKSGAVAPLSIALATAVNIALLIPFFTELTRVFPGMELRFLRGKGAEVAESLKKGDAEIAVAGALGETWDRLDAWPLFTEPYRLIVGAKHPFTKRSELVAADVAKERFLTRTYCENLNAVEAYLKSGGEPVSPSHKVASEHDLVHLLEANLGVSIGPMSSVGNGGVRYMPLEGLELSRTVHVYGVSGRQRSTAANTLIKMLRAADWSALEKRA